MLILRFLGGVCGVEALLCQDGLASPLSHDSVMCIKMVPAFSAEGCALTHRRGVIA